MSTTEKAGILDCLAERKGMTLVNVKFFRGDRDLFSADELRAEVCRAAQQQTPEPPQGKAPKLDRPKVNIRALVASL